MENILIDVIIILIVMYAVYHIAFLKKTIV